MHHRIPTRLAVAAACLFSSSAFPEEHVTVAPVVVTATRTAQTANETVAPVTVITRQEIDASGAQTLPEILVGRPGIDISGNGRFGKSTTVNLRGLGGGDLLFLVNGNRIAAPGSIEGAPSIEHIPAAQIERIEIVRGPRSALYGSNALGGVINIITRRPDQRRIDASAAYGTYSSKRGEAVLSGGNENFDYNLSVAGFETDGYDVRDDSFDDDDGYKNTSAGGRLDWAATERLDINVDFLVNQGTTEFDNCFDAETFAGPFGDCHTDFLQHNFSVGGNYRITNKWDSSLAFSRNSEERRNFYQDTFNNEFEGATSLLSWQNDIQVGTSNLLTAGFDATRDTVEQPDDFAEESRDRVALFGQWQAHRNAHDLVFGLRTIDDEQFGQETVGNIDYGFQVVEGLRLLASAGTAFKAPSLFQLYSPQFGNENLEAETSTSVEFGISGDAKWGRWSMRTYRTYVRNLIEFVSATNSYGNVDSEVEINGLEVEANADLRGWNTNVSYSWNEPVNKETGSVLANRAERSFRIGMNRSFDKLHVGGSIEAQSDRTGSSFTDPVAGYGILNLNARYSLRKNWKLRATMENVFDKTYQTNDQFFGAGRTTFVYLDYGVGRDN